MLLQIETSDLFSFLNSSRCACLQQRRHSDLTCISQKYQLLWKRVRQTHKLGRPGTQPWVLQLGSKAVYHREAPCTAAEMAFWPLSIWCAEVSVWDMTKQRSSLTTFVPHFNLLSVARAGSPTLVALCCCLLLAPLYTLFKDFTHTVTEWRVVLPRWWAEPETLAASLWLSLSCWRPAGWVDCSGSYPATGSWGALQTQRSCNLLIQMPRCLFFSQLSPRD